MNYNETMIKYELAYRQSLFHTPNQTMFEDSLPTQKVKTNKQQEICLIESNVCCAAAC